MTLAGPDLASSTERRLQDAVAAFGAGRFGDAELLCQGILKQQPDHVASLQVLAAVAGQTGAPRRGIELTRRILALQPEHAEGYILLAKLLRLEGRSAHAIAALGKAIELEPKNSAAYNDLGLVHLDQANLAEAAQCFRRAAELSPELAIAPFNLGLVHERQGHRPEAIAAFERAATIRPNFTEAHAKLGNLLLLTGHRQRGLDCFRRAATMADSPVGLMCQARLLVEQDKAAEAETPARQALERDPQNSDAACLLGSVLMELGRFQDAAAAFDLGIALNRRQTGAFHELVHVRRLTQADRPLINHMEWMLREYGLADEERGDIHLALGKAYDDLSEHRQAIGHFDEGNRLKHRTRGTYVASQHAARIDRMIAISTQDFLSRNAAIGCDWEVPVLIVGMPRSGTTLVEQILSSHPEIAAGGELPFWGERASGCSMTDEGAVDPGWADATAQDYRALLTAISPTARRVTDKRLQNFQLLPLIHAVFPRARIIHCRRNPIDTCLSIYFQNFASKIEFAYDRGDLLSYYRQYEKVMAHWRKLLPPARFLEINYEALVEDRETMTRDMIEFCGLEWNEACLHSERNPRPLRTASVWQARQPVYRTSVGRWRHYEPWLGCLRELVPDGQRAAQPLTDPAVRPAT